MPDKPGFCQVTVSTPLCPFFVLGMEFAGLPTTDFPRLAFVQEQLRFGNKVEIPFRQLNHEELAFLR